MLSHHPLRTLLLTAAGAAGVLLLGAAPANAHLGIESSDPANGAILADAPDTATLTWDGAVELDSAAAQLRRIGGPDTPVSEATRTDVPTETLTILSTEERTATFDLPDLEPGLYAIDWAINEEGGHDNTSFIVFKISGPAETSGNAALIVIGAGALAALMIGGAILHTRKKR